VGQRVQKARVNRFETDPCHVVGLHGRTVHLLVDELAHLRISENLDAR
jgi:hypothetical protein